MTICITEKCDRIATVGKVCKYCYNKNRLSKITETCNVEGCTNKVMAKKLCTKHYNALLYPKRVRK